MSKTAKPVVTDNEIVTDTKNIIDNLGGKEKARNVLWLMYYDSLNNEFSEDPQDRAMLFKHFDELLEMVG